MATMHQRQYFDQSPKPGTWSESDSLTDTCRRPSIVEILDRQQFAVTGIYFYDADVFTMCNANQRGELEVCLILAWMVDRCWNTRPVSLVAQSRESRKDKK